MADFFRALFDFNFSTFITMKLIKPLYIFFVVVIGLASLGMFVTFLMGGGTGILIGLILVPIYFVFMTASMRVWMEALVLLFDINDRTEALAAGQQRPQVNPGALPPL